MRVQQWLSSELIVLLTRLSPGAGFHTETSDVAKAQELRR